MKVLASAWWKDQGKYVSPKKSTHSLHAASTTWAWNTWLAATPRQANEDLSSKKGYHQKMFPVDFPLKRKQSVSPKKQWKSLRLRDTAKPWVCLKMGMKILWFIIILLPMNGLFMRLPCIYLRFRQTISKNLTSREFFISRFRPLGPRQPHCLVEPDQHMTNSLGCSATGRNFLGDIVSQG